METTNNLKIEKLDMSEFYRKNAMEDSLQWIKRTLISLESCMRDLENRKTQMLASESGETYIDGTQLPPAHDYFEWGINEVENFVRNINFAAAARACAKLTATAK